MTEAPILLVEDDPDDVLLFTVALAGGDVPLRVVRDGEEALEYLDGRGRYAVRGDHPLPALVVLDLKLPRRSGLEVLRAVRASVTLRDLPVVILSSSEEPGDVATSRALGVLDYLVKPADLSQLLGVVGGIRRRWEALARRPVGA